ncbi:MAG: KaiA family protein [Cyanobacteria bacterium M5B4]|nr:MAG: KaiA family protein [Cyanobacteria bacterium M5B4]
MVPLHIGYLAGTTLPQNLERILPPDRYVLTPVEHFDEGTNLDCLLVFDGKIPDLEIPIVVIGEEQLECKTAQVHPQDLEKLPSTIDATIASFLDQIDRDQTIIDQQHRLSEKLKERLGYLGVYYKRNADQFLRAMSPEERSAYLAKLAETYKMIALEYFKESPDRLNQKIDEFASMAFLADVSVSQVLEIHINLMDQLSKQLRIQGHKDEILLDYRITLIDVIAHLCEMYRRSILPKGGNL